MSFNSVRRRIQRLEGRYRASDDGSFTLEQFSRMYWKADRAGFRRFVKREASYLSMFLSQFEEEEAEAKPARRCGRRAREEGVRP
jgi:hypothetical protein